MALAKIVGLAVTPRIPSATSRPSVPSRRYARVRLSSHGLWPCSSYRRWSMVMSSLLSSMVSAGDRRAHVEHRAEYGGGDREVGQRWVQWLARPAAQSLERAALHRQRRADREPPHDITSSLDSSRPVRAITG